MGKFTDASKGGSGQVLPPGNSPKLNMPVKGEYTLIPSGKPEHGGMSGAELEQGHRKLSMPAPTVNSPDGPYFHDDES